MSTQRSSDVVEIHSARALSFGLSGLIAVALGALFVFYQSMFVGLGWLFIAGGGAAILYGIYCALQVRKVTYVKLVCPYCSASNSLTEQPEHDFNCISCHRMIPFRNGAVQPVYQVRCGFCNHLNYYNDASVGLICESCDREIPIAVAEGVEQKKFFQAYTHKDDDALYELILVSSGNKTEEVINTLQHMLALNRNQVKQMLDELPVTLLTGIPRRKAEMLKAQLALHDATAEFNALPGM